jgi:steroid 5-alpha reductase family enzyme
MPDVRPWLLGLGALLAAATATWLVSVVKRDASIADILWGPSFVLAALVYAWPLDSLSSRGALVLALVTLWAVRLAVHVARRNAAEGEDRRYQEIRRRNEPNFALKSLYIVFWLQAGLAWLVSLPLLAAQRGAAPLGLLDAVGLLLVLGGIAFESVADEQLQRFKHDPKNRGRVLDRGLWRYSRHPNYFGECCVWWGFASLGVAAGRWWSVAAALLMTWLLLRISGVALLERTIGDRRAGYAEYVRRTSAFVPLPPRKPAVHRAPADLEG